jgi:hypothetical protein
VKADKLATSLARLNVQDWIIDKANAVQALKNPNLSVSITLGEFSSNSGPTRELNLRFAPTQPGVETPMYYGQLLGDPDLFYMSRTSLLEILASVFKKP